MLLNIALHIFYRFLFHLFNKMNVWHATQNIKKMLKKHHISKFWSLTLYKFYTSWIKYNLYISSWFYKCFNIIIIQFSVKLNKKLVGIWKLIEVIWTGTFFRIVTDNLMLCIYLAPLPFIKLYLILKRV